MGNSLRAKKTTKIMKINGETIKFKTPIKVGDIVKDYPGHVVLDSTSVKHYGIRAKPLDPFFNLDPKRLYFLVELPKFPHDHQHRAPRRSRSGIQMSAKDRLDSLALSRRSVSDLTIMARDRNKLDTSTGLRVKMRLPKGEIEKLMSQSKDREELAEKIMDIYSSKMGQDSLKSDIFHEIHYEKGSLKGKEIVDNNTSSFFVHALGRSRAGDKKTVGFMTTSESEIGLAIA